jgi:Ca2+-binding EF-hand superfamily protein
LFGDDCTVEEAFEILDDDGNGEVGDENLSGVTVPLEL